MVLYPSYSYTFEPYYFYICSDALDFTFNSKEIDQISKFTKREFLKRIGTLFDPLGFLLPYTVRAKILIQEIWLAGIDRVDSLLDETSRKVQIWFKEFRKVQI